MPRSGPKKVTRRDDRDLERRAALIKHASVENRDRCKEKALTLYQTHNRPNIPSTKCERRALKEALSAEGISMERWSSGNFEECFFHIAKDRYVNQRFPNLDFINEEDGQIELESDPWLQMYLHLPEDYRDKVSDGLEVVNPPGSPDFPSCTGKALRVKMSRSQAKARIEGLKASVREPAHAGSTALVSAAHPAVPLGTVYVLNKGGDALCADASGRLRWAAQPNTESTWTVSAVSGKTDHFHLRSAHGRYLCHCLLSGLVADRTVASLWEEFEITHVNSDSDSHTDSEFRLKSWRGMYVGQTNQDVTTVASVASANCHFRLVMVK